MPSNPVKSLLLAAALAIGGTGLWAALPGQPARADTTIEVWKSPSCGCCGGWIEHMEAAGFTAIIHDTEDMEPVKQSKGVPETLGSCHTAVVDGYVIEGHVPAEDIRRLLAERPNAKGLAVPGMPQDAPGMDMKTGEPYAVMLFGHGVDRVFARH